MLSVLLLAGLAHAWESAEVEPFVSGDGPSAIINGQPATKDEFPMAGGMLLGGTVSLYGFEIEGKLLMCSSTLIAPDVVLLAAHCVDIETMLAASGMGGVEIVDQQFAWSPSADLTQYQLPDAMMGLEWPEDAALATEVVAHPEFDILKLGIGLTKNYDIALMFLEAPVLDVPYAFLPTSEEDDQIVVGMPVDIVGWGQQTSDQQPPPGTVGVKMWGSSFVSEKAPYEFKVGEEVEDVRKCHGDSGGPSFAYVETDSTEDMRVIGVTSHAYDLTDCRLTGGVDTRVGFYLDWIDAEMTKRCEDGTRAWCDWPGIIPPPNEEGLLPWEIEQEDEDTADALDAGGDGEAKAGCGCDSSSGLAGWGLVMLAGAFSRRRRG